MYWFRYRFYLFVINSKTNQLFINKLTNKIAFIICYYHILYQIIPMHSGSNLKLSSQTIIHIKCLVLLLLLFQFPHILLLNSDNTIIYFLNSKTSLNYDLNIWPTFKGLNIFRTEKSIAMFLIGNIGPYNSMWWCCT